MSNLSKLPVMHLGIGELAIIKSPTIIQTVLGSCVSTIMWVPSHHFSMVSHSIYPSSDRSYKTNECDCRYVNSCIERMDKEIRKRGIVQGNVIVKIFGGASQLDNNSADIGSFVVSKTVKMLKQYGYTIDVQETGGNQSRKLLFNSSTGDVYIRKMDT